MESEQSPSSYSPEGKLQLQTIPPTFLKNTASCSQLSNTSDIMDQKSCTEEHFDSDDSWESGYEHSTPTSPETELQFFSQHIVLLCLFSTSQEGGTLKRTCTLNILCSCGKETKPENQTLLLEMVISNF